MQVMPFWVKLIGEPRAQPVPPAHQPALRLRDPAPLSRHRERRPLPRARPLQRQPRAGRVSRTSCSPHGGHWKYDGPTSRMIGALLERNSAHRELVLRLRAARARHGGPRCTGASTSCRRAWAVCSAARSIILLIGSINYALALGFALTFLLAGLGLAGMVHTARNLARIGGERRARRAGVRRRVGAVPPLPRRARAFDRPAILARHLGSGAQLVVDIPARGVGRSGARRAGARAAAGCRSAA